MPPDTEPAASLISEAMPAGLGVGAQAPLLQAAHLARRFPSGEGELVVFEEVAIDLFRGEMVAVVGESGSGKSSLLHLLSGLDRPTVGEVSVGGRSLGTLRGDELAAFHNREVGFVWQFHYLLPEFTALENTMMPLLIRGQPERQAEMTGMDWLRRVGMDHRAHHRSGEMSGGEQQRVALARALVGEPRLLMADEPTGNLDETTAGQVFELLRRLHQEQQLASIIVTHNLRHASRCDRVLELRQRRIWPRETLAPRRNNDYTG